MNGPAHCACATWGHALAAHAQGVRGLHFTAANMVAGGFGNVYPREYLCVQSMDAQLAVYEQARAAARDRSGRATHRHVHARTHTHTHTHTRPHLK